MAVELPRYSSPEEYALEIRRIYEAAETALLKRLTAKLAQGLELTDWESRRLAQIHAFRKTLEAETAHLKKLPPAIQAAVTKAFDEGAKAAVADLVAAKVSELAFDRFTSRGSNVKALALMVTNNLEQAHFQILRQTNDAYRSIIHEVVTLVQGGAMTRRQAAQEALNRFADAGITGFRDVAGRNWDLASYAEMATRSTMAQAAVEGHLQTLQANGQDLVICSAHSEACPLCNYWEGRVLSISGDTAGYPTVDDAREGGLFHPNCTHSLDPYIPGLTRPMTVRIPQTKEGGYPARQKQRHIERQIRKYKRREAVAMDEDSRKQAKAKVREWQGQMREFIDETGRRRDRERESITHSR